ncbi:hypothetical protein Anas_12477 [Armadillidium nasatum]|uniref:SCP domain-containing protein n=1 Tax=Armadillidium nasatum TaxID=96803 RepID=A0A5N5TDN5_9CRUS|nr:hypothetical protein Anas_12477 [Armadillidium nasatum]
MRSGGYGHYTRIIWGKTCYIGCGASKYYDGTWYNYFVACNYCEGGNYLGQAVYDVPCKNSKKYSNLCCNGLRRNMKAFDALFLKHEEKLLVEILKRVRGLMIYSDSTMRKGTASMITILVRQ